jgi:large subunit ribosomal protein L24
MAAKLKKGDPVIVLSGKDKGKTGEIIKIFPDEGRAIVAGVNTVKRHTKPGPQGAGGIQEKEAPIQLSNIAYRTEEGKPSRVGFKLLKDGKKVRVLKANNETLDA